MLSVAVRQAAVQLVGERIRAARKGMRRRGGKEWRQKDLAKAVSVEPTTVGRWERGATSPDIYMLERIAEATKKPMSFFVTGESEPATEPVEDETSRTLMALARIEERLASLEGNQDLMRDDVGRIRDDLDALLRARDAGQAGNGQG